MMGAVAMDQDELKQALYEVACDRNERRRKMRGDPSPEEIGRIEAREIIALNQWWKATE